MKIELGGLSWEQEGDDSYRLIGWPFRLVRDSRGWFAECPNSDKPTVRFASLDEAIDHVVMAFEVFGVSAA
jgi:hypothetical protein